MGRELRRVPLDFNWPLDKPWGGFINPHYADRQKCPVCDGDSHSLAGRLLNDLWYLRLYGERVPAEIVKGLARKPHLPISILTFAARVVAGGVPWYNALEQEDVDALVEGGRLWDFVRVPRTDEQREIVRAKVAAGGNSWLPADNGYRPTAAEVNAWAAHGFGHDAINAWICQKARAKKYGVATYCRACRGTGHVPDATLARRIRAWRETPVPTGPGWQVWETVSEGSPVTPVFPRAEDLARHMATVGVWNQRTDYETALRWLRGSGHAMSGAMVGGKMVDPIALAAGDGAS